MAKGSTTRKTAANLHSATDRMAESAHAAVDGAAEYSGRTEERLRQQADRASRQYHDAQGRASVKGREVHDELMQYLNEHPYQSLGIAVAAGYILGAILRNR